VVGEKVRRYAAARRPAGKSFAVPPTANCCVTEKPASRRNESLGAARVSERLPRETHVLFKAPLNTGKHVAIVGHGRERREDGPQLVVCTESSAQEVGVHLAVLFAVHKVERLLEPEKPTLLREFLSEARRGDLAVTARLHKAKVSRNLGDHRRGILGEERRGDKAERGGDEAE
jgi:hypothetical protein